ncbi:alpha/beta hydrolase fold domain-containing protein [Streptomyces sp. NPDC057052]|uniref:alpha/beta hydrolase fold domain-containing protein n=1 Tax=Streptomyces sp. NPDC057052 TaxID=3346010 RepID=UPI0036359056
MRAASRLAPEATGTALVDDCHQGLLRVAEHAEEPGIDPVRIAVAGAGAGGCHGFDAPYPRTRIPATVRRTRTAWRARLLTA